ncbi:hypothetical protein BDZ97DRAFT_1318301 [Flammula alnicola]|nr:hypothetical protein BDZ97DRAFT_1318301 [Flammula alnicola]
MASWMRSTSFGIPQICTRSATARYYSDSAFLAGTNKWQLAGVPRPRSILEDDDAVVDLSEDSEIVNGGNPNSPPPHLRRPSGKPTPHEYKAHRDTLRKSFPEGWSPPRKLSREAMDALRQLNRAEPEQFNSAVLAEKFKISPEAVRRILKSKWQPSAEKRTTMAIKERKEKQIFVKERATKEQFETSNVRELKNLSRVGKRMSSKDDRNSDERGPHGISPADTFTFQ